MLEWKIPEDAFTYLLSKNFFPLMEKSIEELGVNPRFVGIFIGQHLKFTEGHYAKGKEFNYSMIYDLFKFLKEQHLDFVLAKKMLPVYYEHPKMDFDSILTSVRFKKLNKEEILSRIPFLSQKFKETAKVNSTVNKVNWIMGELRPIAIGNTDLSTLAAEIK